MKHLKLLFSALSLLSFSSLQAADTPPEIKIGDQARDFTLNSANNKSISLSDYEGKNIVLVFGRSHR
ncbi:MAG: redoxin domain-containing protein [Akkermansiaceae bacterium]